MTYVLKSLNNKREVDDAIKTTTDKVLCLRFGRDGDVGCLQCDDILAKTAHLVSNMADVYIVDVDQVETYTQYFDVTLIPATIFFFNGQHMKVDYGTQDNTKFIGPFHYKQDFIDLVEVIYRGAMKGKLIVTSPIDSKNVPKYNLIYNDI